MKKFWDKMWDWLATIWGALWILIITLGSVSVLIAVTKWFLRLVGVL